MAALDPDKTVDSVQLYRTSESSNAAVPMLASRLKRQSRKYVNTLTCPSICMS